MMPGARYILRSKAKLNKSDSKRKLSTDRKSSLEAQTAAAPLICEVLA